MNKRTYCTLQIIILLIAGCQEKNDTNLQQPPHYLEVHFKEPVNDTTPFCKVYISGGEKTNKPIPNEKDLKFKPTEMLAINFTDNFLRRRMNEPVDKALSDTIFYLYGIDGENDDVICLDENNNGIFSDDKFYKTSQMLPFIKISNLKFIMNDKVKTRSLFIQPVKGANGLSAGSATHGISFFMMAANFKTETTIDNRFYKFALFNLSHDQLYDSKVTSLVVIPASDSFKPCTEHQVQYKIGDTIYFGKSIYRFDSVAKYGDRIFLDSIGKANETFGVDESLYVLNIIAKDILTNKVYKTDTLHKFLLLDFWGTWCKPCIASTGKLKEINRKYSGAHFQLISIAKDRSEKEVKQYLRKENISWINFFEDWENPGISNRFIINAYPTFLLIGPDGKILLRIAGADQLSKIDEILSKELGRG